MRVKPQITTLAWVAMLLAVCTPTQHASVFAQARASESVDATEQSSVIDVLVTTLQTVYVFPAISARLATGIRARQATGAYDRLTDATRFAQALTEDLQAISNDKHLVVEVADAPTDANAAPAAPKRSPAHANAPLTSPQQREACHFVNVATLTGNVGYIKFDAFASPSMCAETAGAAMNLVAGCDALVVDLRDNRGGDPAMVAFMASYLFMKPVRLSDVFERRTGVTYETWTLPFVPGPRFVDTPVFIVTSHRTFSAAEQFAYDLQSLKRAVVVGEPSGGGAHPTESFAIDARFSVSVPIGRYVNPITQTNWEGRGVEPSVHVHERVSVQAAYREALRQILNTSTPDHRVEIQRQIDALTKAIGGS